MRYEKGTLEVSPSFREGGILLASVDPACRWRLVEEYGPDSFTIQPDGRLRFTWGFPDADSVLSWVLTFGEGAELTEPEELRLRLAALTATLVRRYQKEV